LLSTRSLASGFRIPRSVSFHGRRFSLHRVGEGTPACLPMAAKPLTPAQIAALPRQLPEWTLREGKLHREWRFADFSEAFGFMTRVALAAEALGHHPEWCNVWNRVTINLTTHDTRGLSDLDLALARRIDTILS